MSATSSVSDYSEQIKSQVVLSEVPADPVSEKVMEKSFLRQRSSAMKCQSRQSLHLSAKMINMKKLCFHLLSMESSIPY